MLKNAPFLSHRHGNLTIEGWSRAAVQSYWRIPELKLGFDLGAHPWDFMGIPNWMISHCHLDHIAAIPLYVARRRLMNMEPPRIWMPTYATDKVRVMLRSFEQLDRGRMHCDLIGVEPGEEFELSRELVVKVVATQHTMPSLGFIVYERRKKLKPQYLDLTGEEIRDLRESGVAITEERRVPMVGYTGDTAPSGLDNNPEFYRVKVLITEMTFIAADHRRNVIHKNGHMHLDDFVERENDFQNELIVAGHCSTRYSRQQAKRLVGKALPGMMNGRLRLWV